MTLHIVVPVKRLAESKRRLSVVLPDEERLALAWSLLRHVLSVVQEAQHSLPARGAVISPDPAALDAARSFGLTPLVEEPPAPGASGGAESGLNAALEQAGRWASGERASALLILPADLPFVSLADIQALWQASQQLYSEQAMVIAPDGHRSGTNALLVRPPDVLRFQFGPDSFHRHCQQAQERGVAYHVFDRSQRLGLDVDLPADLAQYLALEQGDLQEETVHQNIGQGALDPADEAFLSQPGLLMRLGTTGSDGFPHVTPVWFMFCDGMLYVTTAADRVKTRNMLRDPRVGFAIDSDVRPYRGLSATGTARLVAEGEEARPLTRLIAARYVPPERLEAMVDSLMQAPRVVFAIAPRHVSRLGSWGDLAAS